jgi:hypothetical protein
MFKMVHRGILALTAALLVIGGGGAVASFSSAASSCSEETSASRFDLDFLEATRVMGSDP